MQRYWTTDTVLGATLPTNRSRPGGALTTKALGPADGSNTEVYVLLGDTQSMTALLPWLERDCDYVDVAPPASLDGNTTLESYRDDSFQLLRFPEPAGSGPSNGLNGTLENCLEMTLSDKLLVANTSAPMEAAGVRAHGGAEAAGPVALMALFLSLFLLHFK